MDRGANSCGAHHTGSIIGLLVNNVWSFAGEFNRARVNQMTAQYFVNYNFRGGWYLTSTPIITTNWVAKPGDQLGRAHRRRFRACLQD